MPNLGIYVSAPLVERLNRLKERGTPVNISVTCQQALERQVDLMESPVSSTRKEQIIARLQQAKTPLERTRAAGNRAGRRWAEESAAWGDLDEVANWLTVTAVPRPNAPPQPMEFLTPLRMREGFPADFAQQIDEPYRRDVSHVREFWQGFKDGAKQIHDLVEPEMRGRR